MIKEYLPTPTLSCPQERVCICDRNICVCFHGANHRFSLYFYRQNSDCIKPETRAATAASWAMYGLATEWSHSRHMPPVEQYADQVLPLLAANLGISMEFDGQAYVI